MTHPNMTPVNVEGLRGPDGPDGRSFPATAQEQQALEEIEAKERSRRIRHWVGMGYGADVAQRLEEHHQRTIAQEAGGLIGARS